MVVLFSLDTKLESKISSGLMLVQDVVMAIHSDIAAGFRSDSHDLALLFLS